MMLDILNRISSRFKFTTIQTPDDRLAMVLTRAQVKVLIDALNTGTHLTQPTALSGTMTLRFLHLPEPTLDLRWQPWPDIEDVRVLRCRDTPDHRTLLIRALREQVRRGHLRITTVPGVVGGTIVNGTLPLTFGVPLDRVVQVVAAPWQPSAWVTDQLWGERVQGSEAAILRCQTPAGEVLDIALTWRDLVAAQRIPFDQLELADALYDRTAIRCGPGDEPVGCRL
jgi:hypothetical protein